MVVSLQRDKVTGKPPYLHPISSGRVPLLVRKRRTSAAGEPPEVAENLRGYE